MFSATMGKKGGHVSGSACFRSPTLAAREAKVVLFFRKNV
jgi:hypothetical protein